MEPETHVDLTGASFDDFVSFLFDHDPPPERRKGDRYDPWYFHFHVEVEFDAPRICTYYVRLFREPEFLLTRFTKPQLEEGFWAIQCRNLGCSVARMIRPDMTDDLEIPLSIRAECIRAMYDLYRRLFATEPLDSSVNMWWDAFCYDWHCGIRNRDRGGEDMELQDIFFETLARVLSIDSETCQTAALHGLGHLHHPGTKDLIERFIDERPSLTEKQKQYALDASRFQVL